MLNSNSYLCAEWPASSNIRAYSTTRLGGFSCSPFGQFNLAHHVGDKTSRVIQNRQKLRSDFNLCEEPVWLDQVHSCKVIDANNVEKHFSNKTLVSSVQADASYSLMPNQVCVVMTADCMPILFTNKMGNWVAAIHAGWRGLLGGIVQNTIAKYSGNSSELIAWLGPTISQSKFEVGSEVREQFTQINSVYSTAFINTNKEKYQCDLYAIARMILEEYNINSYGGNFCTYTDRSLFYSYRRKAKTGRMASLIWMDKINTELATA